MDTPRIIDALEIAFERFDRCNPHIYELFTKFTLEAIKAGRTAYSSRTIFHRIRWHVEVDTVSDDRFKINNNHSPYYARKLMDQMPVIKGFFRTREIRKDRNLRLAA